MFYGRYDYPTGKFLWGNLRYQRVSEYNLQIFLNMKNSKLREEQIMSAKRDYYEVLGVSRDADKNTIKKAYRKLAKKYHPDTNQGNAQAAERFKEATEAYNILSDPEKKKMYDQFGHAAFDGSGAAGGAYGGAYSRNGGGTYQYAGPDGTFHEYHFEGNGDMDDFLKNIFGGSFGGFGGATRSYSKGSRSGFSGSGFGESGSYANYGQDGADVTAEITVGFDEAAFGCEKVIHLTENNGKTVGKALKVKIPAGIDTGKSIRLRGKGNPGINGGKAGDLLLKVKVASKPGYERKGMDVYTTVRVPFTTAVLGGEAKVETLHGNVLCKINPGTQSGTKIRLRGKGIVSMKDKNQHGDQYVTVQIDVPGNLSEEAKRKLREFEVACKKGQQGVA